MKNLLKILLLITTCAILIAFLPSINNPKVPTREPIAFAGVDFTTGESMRTDANTSAFSGLATIYFFFNATSITQGTLLDNGGTRWKVYLSANKLYFYKKQSGSNDEGLWSTPVSANTNYQVAIYYDHSSCESCDPVIYLNGAAGTVTEEITPTNLAVDTADITYIGGNSSYGDALQGVIGEVAFFSGTMSTTELAQLTNTRLARYPLQISTLVNYWPMDEFPDGGDVASASTILPDSNVTTTWSAGSFSSVNSSNDVYASANGSDDNETFQVGYGTFTIPAGETGIGFKMSVEGNDGASGGSGTAKYKLGGGSNVTLGACCSTDSDGTTVFRTVTAMSQSQLDGFEGAVSVGSMGATDELNVDYIPVIVYSTKYWSLDYKGNTIKVYGFAGKGAAGKYLSY